MSNNEKVCRLGSATLAPILVVTIAAVVFGVIAGVILTLDHFFPHGPLPGIHPPAAVGYTCGAVVGAFFVAMLSAGMYPYLYRHCRGAEVLAKFEALDKEAEAIQKDYWEKIGDVSKRREDLMHSLRTTPNGSAAEHHG